MGTTLLIENIGPIKSAEVVLDKTVLYGPNAAGKTTIAKSLKLMLSLLGNIRIRCGELIEGVRYGADVGRIAFKDYVVEITRAGDYKKAGIVIKKGDGVVLLW
jgi:predicted ATPase